MSLSFHNTFPLDRDNIAKLLAVVNENSLISNVDIASATGIGIGATNPRKGKVQPTIDYAVFSGLLATTSVDRTRRLDLTDTGKIVFRNDAWIRKPVTQWIMHYRLSKQGSDAEAWEFFVHEFLPNNAEFARPDLEAALLGKFGHKVQLKILNLGVLLNCYLEGGGLERIRLVREQEKRRFARTQPYIPNAYTVGYILAEIWDAKHPERLMIDPMALLEPGHLGTTMSLGEGEVTKWLDELSALGIIEQMREAPPYQVAWRWRDKLELLERAYTEEG